MLDRENLVALGKALANADKKAPIAYSFEGKNYNYEALNETFRQELNEMVGTPKLFNQNKYEMFELLEEVIDDSFAVRVVKPWDIRDFERENAVDNVFLWD